MTVNAENVGASGWLQPGRVSRAAGRLAARARSVGWVLTDQCIVSAGNFLTIFLFARHLEASVFGTIMLAYTGLLLLTNLQNALVVQPHNVLAAGLADEAYRRFTGALAVLQAAYCLATGAILCAAGGIAYAVGAPATGGVLLALGLAAVPWMAQDFVRRVLYTRGQSRAAAANDAVTSGLQLFGAVALVGLAARWATAASALTVLGLASAAGALFGAWQLRGQASFARPGEGIYRRAWLDAWHFGKWLTAQNGLAWFGAQGHSWVVGILLGVEQVGIYRAVTHLINLMNPLMQACFSYLPSRGSLAFQAGGASGLAHWVSRTLRTLVLALLPFAVVLVGFPGLVLDLAYGGRFSENHLALILALAALAQVIGFSKYPFDLGLLALRSPRSIFLAYLIPVLLLTTVGAGLIAWLGITGVPLSAIVINTSLFLVTRRAYRERLREERGRAPAAAEAR